MTQKSNISVIKGCHSYDILANPLYDFQYVSPSVQNRDKYIIDDDSDEGNDCAQSDIVRIALNLAYMNEKEAHNFCFDAKHVTKKLQAGLNRGLL